MGLKTPAKHSLTIHRLKPAVIDISHSVFVGQKAPFQ